MKDIWKYRLSGMAAGFCSGLFGGGGGMVLVPCLTRWCRVEEKKAFASCVAIIFPFCVISAGIYLWRSIFDWLTALPYLAGGVIGGLLGGMLFKEVSVIWLRRIFGVFLLYGGVRYLL